MDGLVWVGASCFSLLIFTGTNGLGVWERTFATALGFLAPFFLFGGMIIVVRRIIEPK